MNYSFYDKIKVSELSGRYICLEHIEPLIEKLPKLFKVEISGYSVENRPIYHIEWGRGEAKILAWSQMHGNESTTTKAVFDLLNYLATDDKMVQMWHEKITLHLIPMLNPDGAESYTRENAADIDLNRDFLDLSQPESLLLMNIFNEIDPDFCFNLHDQRTIFGVGKTGKPATISFLAPAFNEACEINETRQKAVNIIVAMNDALQKHIPGQVGRFDDTFNRNCAGDTFQSMGVPTILFEAGHYPGDYEREDTRKLIFISLISALKEISENDVVDNKTALYLNIPQNNQCFFDFVYRNVNIDCENSEIITSFAAQYKEVLVNKKIWFEAYISCIGELKDYFGHIEYDAKNQKFQQEDNHFPIIDNKANFFIGKNNKYVNGLIKFQQ